VHFTAAIYACFAPANKPNQQPNSGICKHLRSLLQDESCIKTGCGLPLGAVQGNGSMIPGLESALLGMRPGGKRRALVPPEVGYLAPAAAGVKGGLQPAMPTFATQRQLENHKNEPLLFEYQMLRVGDRRQ
jgi:hypothetical protein